MNRRPLKPGSVVKMPNGGQYVIRGQIGEGGLSLIYDAVTKANEYPVIIKEFFPSEHAHRADRTVRDGSGATVCRRGRVCPDDGWSARFEECLEAFEREGRLGSSARGSSFQIIAFSDCGDGYAVLPRWSSDSCSFGQLEKEWRKAPPASIDPVFTDLGRIRFALTAVGSLLTALEALHAQNVLHLDVSPGNAVWAGRRASPENGAAFLTDFGCSVYAAEDGAYPAERALSCSREYAAPEYKEKGGRLDRRTDVYSAGRLLALLCLGRRALWAHSVLENELRRLRLPPACRQGLLAILQKATEHDMDRRYRSAAEMRAAVDGLLASIPQKPCNPDNTTAFTLYSLRNMLEGSAASGCSWAHELRDRRGASVEVPEQACKPVSSIPGGRFADDWAFLKALLPEETLGFLEKKLSGEPDRAHYLNCVMSANCPAEWKAELAALLETSYVMKRLIAKCGTLLKGEQAFRRDVDFLLRLRGGDIGYFAGCYAECGDLIAKQPGGGLALLTLFALLGQGERGFASFAQHSPRKLREMLQD